MGRLKTITRRTFFVGSAAIAGGVVFGYWKYKRPYDNPLLANLAEGEVALTPYVRIDQSGITIITPRAEMGQGVHTTLAAMVAEELDVTLDSVQIEHGPASNAYYNAVVLEEGLPFAPTDSGKLAEAVRSFTHVPAKFLGIQVTGGSSTTVDGYLKMRQAGAAARDVLLQAAARRMDVSKADLSTDNGAVVAPDGSRIGYPELAELAATLEPPGEPVLKPQSEWKILGRSTPRVDMVAKCTGTAEFAIDVVLPDMLFATVKMNPGLGGSMRGLDASAAESMRGVKQIVPLDGGFAVVATNTWYAFRAAEAVVVDWSDAPYPGTTAEHFQTVTQAFDGEHDSRARDDGDTDEGLSNVDVIEGEYRAPYLAHATMEPMNAVALFKGGQLDIWAGNQIPTQAVKDGALIAGVDENDVRVHTTLMGGGFGRRAETDFIKYAVQVATALPGIPIKLTYSREEDMSHDFYRPLAIARFQAAVEDGKPTSLDLELASPSVLDSQLGRIGMPSPGPDLSIVQAAWDQPYGIPNYRVSGYRAAALMPIGYWRSVGASQNGFFHESIIDELAHAAGADPLAMRLSLLTHDVSRQVVEAVARMSDWGSQLPPGHARGIAFVMAFGVPVAEVVEVADTDDGIRIVRVFAAADVGTALDPGNIEAQIQSGINFGLAAAMMGEVTLADGRVQQQNFHNYDSIRMLQAPPIEVQVLENGHRIRGIGEPGTPPAAPALANAIFAATGQRIRELPLQKHIRFA